MRITRRFLLSLLLLLAAVAAPVVAEENFSFGDAQAFFKSYCLGCHQGKSASGGLNLSRFTSAKSLLEEQQKWNAMGIRIRAGERPPKGAPGPAMKLRQGLSACADNLLKA